MSKLGQLLSYLERPGVTELVFRSGVPAVMCSASRMHPLTVAPLQVSQIRRFFEGTEVIAHLRPGVDIPAHTAAMELLGVTYQVTLSGGTNELEVRIGKNAPKRASTWTDLPASEPPSRSAQSAVTRNPPSPGTAEAEPARDSSSGMLAASPKWTIERNDDHGLDLARPDTTTRRDVSAVPLPKPEQDPTEAMLGEIEDSSGLPLRTSVPTPRPRPLSAPHPVSGAHDVANVPMPVSRRSVSQPHASASGPHAAAPVPVSRRPVSEPHASASGAHAAAPAPRRTLSGPHIVPRTAVPVHARLREILIMARQHAASDVHIMSGNPVRVRRSGALEVVGGPVAHAEVEAMVGSLLQPSQAAQLDALGYADLAADVDGAGRVRINVGRQRTGLKLCFRLVVSTPPSIAALGLPPEVHKLTTHHQGLMIVSGPNGHGKTTSMAAVVDMFNAGHSMHIITVEDPVEVMHPRKQAIVSQREVGKHTRSFARALAAALREDPDVIAIGELRDRETVEMALSASETGHLVVATMSTPSGAKTIDRLIDMFPPDDQAQVRATLAGALKLVLSQRLLRRADGRGLVAAFEMISGGIPLWSLIRDNKLFQLPSLLQRGRNFGMISLEDSLRELLSSGAITREEALAYAEDPKALAPRESATPSPGASASGWRSGRG